MVLFSGARNIFGNILDVGLILVSAGKAKITSGQSYLLKIPLEDVRLDTNLSAL